MTSRSIPQNISKSDNNLNSNQKEDSDLANIDNSDLYLFLQFYFRDATKNLKKILSDNVITNESEIPKITSSFNFWLNFALNFKDNSFVDLLLNKSDKVGGSKVQKNLNTIKNNIDLSKDDNMIIFSSVTKQGREEVLKLIESLLVETI